MSLTHCKCNKTAVATCRAHHSVLRDTCKTAEIYFITLIAVDVTGSY